MGEVEDLIKEVSPRYSEGPIWQNNMTYDTNTNALEPIYYWIIDFIASYKPEKIVDSFTAAPGSSYFADLGQKATRMQEEGMKILGMVNTIIKSVMNIVYDLKNFDQRLKEYKRAKSKNPKEKEAGILALKQIWLNSVDSLRGMGSLNNMAQSPQPGFVLLRSAFMYADEKGDRDVRHMDLNDMAKRILIPRVQEFYDWVNLSYDELAKRYEIQKSYLKSQVATLKLYSRWVTPYLRAAEQLRMKENTEPGLVSVFGAMILELSLLGKRKIDVVSEARAKNLPPYFAKTKVKIRDTWQVLTVDFKFRTYPTQAAPHTGKVEISFKAYALNEDELLLFEKLRENDTIKSILQVSEVVSEETLAQLEKDIETYAGEGEKVKPKQKTLFEDLYKAITGKFVPQTRTQSEKAKKEKAAKEKKEIEDKKKKLAEEGIREDNYEESVVRKFAEINAAEFAFKAYDIFKKSQRMASFPSPFDEPDMYKTFRQKRAEIANLLRKQ